MFLFLGLVTIAFVVCNESNREQFQGLHSLVYLLISTRDRVCVYSIAAQYYSHSVAQAD